MKKPLETAKRWLVQAEYSLSMMHSLLEGGFWAGACFQVEQTAQLALRAFLYWRGRRFVTIHSIRALALECGKEDAQFLAFENYGIILDRYYLGTRYPDVLPDPAIPFESFIQQEARQALNYASEIVGLVRAQIPTQ